MGIEPPPRTSSANSESAHASSSDTSPVAETGETEAEAARFKIHHAKSEIREGYNTADVERVLAAYAEGFGDLSAGLPSFGRLESKAVLRARLQALFADYAVELRPIIVQTLVLGDTAMSYGWQEMGLTPKLLTNQLLPAALERRTRYVERWQKGGDGAWRITLSIDNLDQPSVLVEDMLAELASGAVSPFGERF